MNEINYDIKHSADQTKLFNQFHSNPVASALSTRQYPYERVTVHAHFNLSQNNSHSSMVSLTVIEITHLSVSLWT